MSKANSPVKVLHTALKRVNKGWTKSNWHTYSQVDKINYVCLEGAVYGYCSSDKHEVTDAQRTAIKVLESIIAERHDEYEGSIPNFNDAVETSFEDIVEVIKLGIIRLETGWDPDGVDDKNFDEHVTTQG